MMLDAIVARVLDDALADAERQIEPAMRGVTLLEVLYDTQRVKIVVEATTMTAEAAVQRALPGVSKGRMADVVNQGESLRQIFVQAERGSNSPCDLRDLNGVGQAAAKMIGGSAGEYLRLPRETPEGAGLHNALAIALEGRARRAERCGIDAGQKEIVGISGDRASIEIDCHSQI